MINEARVWAGMEIHVLNDKAEICIRTSLRNILHQNELGKQHVLEILQKPPLLNETDDY
jgi:hypothetical protein